MLNSKEISKFKIEDKGESKEVAGARTCRWNLKNGLLSVTFNEDRGLDELNFSEGKVDQTTLAGRKAKLVRGLVGPGGCDLAFEVDPQEAIVVGGVKDNTAAACKLAKKAAPMVEAKLPES